jgi:hypothetical protein
LGLKHIFVTLVIYFRGVVGGICLSGNKCGKCA